MSAASWGAIVVATSRRRGTRAPTAATWTRRRPLMIAMTMMVRDEADIVGAMIQHHLDQGVDLFLVTDNGSVDGTTEILEAFAEAGKIELSHDPRHLKQQHEVVTRMSREAARRGARWVLNADA